MKYITSRHNQIIKKIIELKTAKKRAEYGLFVAEGYRTVLSFLSHGYLLDIALSTEKAYPTIQMHISPAAILLVDDHLMSLISSSVTPSGIVALFKIPDNPTPEKLTSGIVLAQIQDPGNMGTIIRTAAALAIKSVVIIEGCDPWSPKVVQATAGASALTTIFRWSWQELLQNKKDLSLCALVVRNGTSPEEINFNNQLLVVGNEAHGLPEEWQHDCDTLLHYRCPEIQKA